MRPFKKLVPSQGGQALTELALILPMLLVLALGAIEVSNMIQGYLTLSHLTREGANMISRGIASPDSALDAIIESACPPLCTDNQGQWKVIYSRVGPRSDPIDPSGCEPDNDTYVVLEQFIPPTKGSLDEPSKLGSACDQVTEAELPNIDQISTGNNLYIVEAFYQYEAITPVGNMKVNLGNPIIFYERAVF